MFQYTIHFFTLLLLLHAPLCFHLSQPKHFFVRVLVRLPPRLLFIAVCYQGPGELYSAFLTCAHCHGFFVCSNWRGGYLGER